ncbi:hypothetical protein X907_2555 [Glycocaulis alkaliphilus]|uniref:Uncharacterized protein n=1 Tax=Glycocaulis alkaliphilus TaxID=1434191 RepID=A0A3T0ECN7_9PROT|nr:hypothetical protein [Glycocaulis alkaliphilus]AZU05067.1 hypothetical protein X907_2555 [Glycocaulis alkaliphilus]GGB65483.1 hypothetical protein GCM10007417_01530 [Glycocaulis alkaliphilus]
MGWFRYPLGLVLASIFMALAGVIVQTQFVLSALAGAGAQISAADRLSMTLADMAGLGPLYLVFILIGFLIAFLAGALVVRFTPVPRTAVYAVAGAVCMFVMLMLMREVFFGVPVIAGARSLAGEISQAVCGALAGVFYAWMTSRQG